MRRSRLLFSFPSRDRLCLGIAVFSYRSLPHWGRGTAPAVDRVLSYIVDLRRISSPSFIPLEPYPARFARHLPHAGKALSIDIVLPTFPIFALTMREKRHSRIVSLPIGEGFVRRYCFPHVSYIRSDDRGIAVDRVLSFIVDLRRISPSLSYR